MIQCQNIHYLYFAKRQDVCILSPVSTMPGSVIWVPHALVVPSLGFLSLVVAIYRNYSWLFMRNCQIIKSINLISLFKVLSRYFHYINSF